jgi:hypothetical protein
MLVSVLLLLSGYLIRLLLILTPLLDCFLPDMTRQYSALEENALKIKLNWSGGALILRKSIPKVRQSWLRSLLL